MKTKYADDPAIVEEQIAQAAVQRFALDIFEKGDKPMRANNVTAQTADSFQAASTFLSLLQIWGPPTAEIAAKTKYAKFHAARILKAIKAGEDPNASNPQPEPEPEPAPLDPNDPDLQSLERAAAQQPTVEDDPYEVNGFPPNRPPSARSYPGPSSGGGAPMSHSHQVSPPIQASGAPSPLGSAPSVQNPRKDSAGGGYFPEVASPPPSLPPVAPAAPGAPSAPPPLSPPDADMRSYYQTSPPPQPSAPPPHFVQGPPLTVHQMPAPQPRQAFAPSVAPPAQPPPIAQEPGQYITDDAAVAEASKHAKWAISALNFEDVPTAVKELRIALRNLGAG